MKLLPLILLCLHCAGQTINVKQLYAKYPTTKSSLCAGCKLWVNPVFTSIADTAAHYPVLERYIYTRAHELRQQALKLPRSGIYAAWHPVTGQPNMAAIYKAANKVSKYEIALGHVCAWIWLAYSDTGTVLSDTYDFNEAAEYQQQNIGTEIAVEEYIRGLALQNDTVKCWGGCFMGDKPTVYAGLTLPTAYWKLIKYNGKTEAWFLPNSPDQTRDKLSSCIITPAALTLLLGFNPENVLK